MRPIRYTLDADRDIFGIAIYYSDRNATAGAKILAAIEARCRSIARFPQTGVPQDELCPGLRSVSERGYRIFFRVTNEELIIMRVLHGSRDVTTDMFDYERRHTNHHP